MLTLSELRAIMPRAGGSAATYLEPLNSSCDEFQIDNPDRLAAFLATLAVESAELTRVSENMHYTTPQRIADVFPSRFPNASKALPYVGKPEQLANVVYANRMGNGPVESGDGWRFRGAGLVQITGAINHENCAKHFQMTREQVGDWMRTPMGAARSAGFYWWRNALNVLADQGQFEVLTRKINPAKQEMARRWAYLAVARRVLA